MDLWDRFFEATRDALCVADAFGRVQRSNRAMNELLSAGGSDSAVSLADAVVADDADSFRTRLQSLGPETPNASVECRLASDPSRWTRWELTRVDENRIVASAWDITPYRRTSSELEAKEALLTSVIENEPECVKLVARDGTLLEMNAAGLRMVAAETKGEAVGACVYDVIAPEDRERYQEFNERVCDGERGELRFDIIGLDGCRRSMESVAVPLRYGPEARPVQLAITRDVSERVRLESQLQHAQKMEAIGRLAGGIAHDFNNLLTAIIGPTELLLLDAGPDAAVSDRLNQIKGTAERAAQLTSQLLAFARRQIMKPESVSLPDLVVGVEEMLRRIIGESYELFIYTGDNAGSVYVDRGQLEQVLVNLVVNARDSMPEGGPILIRTRGETIDPEEAKDLALESGAYGVLSVHDAGPGIPPDVLPNVFEPFFSTKKGTKGTGLGLATSYGIATQAGGTISVKSDEGGSTFEVYLPKAKSEAVVETFHEPEPVERGYETILVVEDEEIVRRTIVEELLSLGYEVIAAEDGESAIRALGERSDVALILTDVMMPRMSGPSLVESLPEKHRGIRVLYMTGYSPASLTDKLGPGGTKAMLRKPFDRTRLNEAVRAVLDDDAVRAG